jgi:hypothetical protein
MDRSSAFPAPDARMLTDTELLMLDMLIYHVRPEMGVFGTRVQTLADQVEQNLRVRMVDKGVTSDAEASNNMTYGEWFGVMRGIRSDPALSNLVLEAYMADERDARMGCFVDDRDNAYVAFSGTGVGEWMDNFLAGYAPDTKQQLRAHEWLTSESIPRAHTSLTLSGHSKGGNKAMYCAIRTGEAVTRAVTFDGQGFSKTFIANYQDKLDAFQGKVTWYASDADPVNGLCFPVVPAEHRHYLTHESGLDRAKGSMIRFHSPMAMLEKDSGSPCGYRLRDEGPQQEQSKVSTLFMDYMVGHLDPEMYERFCCGLGMIVDNVVPSKKSADDRCRDLLAASQTDAFAIAVSSFVRFLTDTGHPMTVHKLLELILPDEIAGDLDLDVLASRIEKVMARNDSERTSPR